MGHARALILAGALAGALAAACAPAAPRPDASSLVRLFPARAAAITGGRSAFAATPAGFERLAGALRVTLPARGEDRIRMETARGFTLAVREPGAGGSGVVDGAAVAYARPSGTSWWRSSGEGVEEWLVLEPGAATAGEPLATWEVEGGTLRVAGAALEIADDAGVARVRVAAPAAYTASGRSLTPRLAAQGTRIALFVDDAPRAEALLVDPTWTPTSAMSTARQSHTATRLPDGRVLIAGGYGTEVEKSAELYDPATGAFSLTGSMAVPRVNHFAVLLLSGVVLVAGGDGSSAAELYDPATGVWSDGGMLSTVRTKAAGVLLPGGEVLLAGGDGDAGGSADRYDPAAGTWSPTAPLHTPRRWHTATLLLDGTVLVAGGVTSPLGHDAITATAEIYDPTADAWTVAAALPEATAQHTATALADGRVLVAGGTAKPGVDSLTELGTTQIFDPAKATWAIAAFMARPRAVHTATRLPTGAVLVTGGLDASGSAESAAELFDPAMASVPLPWIPAPSMTRDRILHTATLLADGTVLVAGGEDQSSAELFTSGQPGDPCAVDPQCVSAHCVDGVCCASACADPCHTCAARGSAGTCLPAGAGTDPRGDCGDGGACDPTCGGGSTCVGREGTACTAGGCTADGEGQFAAAICTAGIRDCPVTAMACSGGYRCDADAGACRDACSSLDDCATGYACDPSHRCVPPSAADSGSAPSCAHGASEGEPVALAPLGALALLVMSVGWSRARARRAAARRGA